MSEGEIFIALKAKFKPEKILYNHIARKEEIVYALEKEIKFFNFEAFDVDAGMIENPRPALYTAYHHIEPLKNKKGKR